VRELSLNRVAIGAALCLASTVHAAPQSSAPDSTPTLRVSATIEPAFALAEHRALDVDDEAGAEIVAVGFDGEVRTYRVTPSGARPAAGTLKLSEPRRAVFAFEPLAGTGRPELFVSSPRGLEVFSAGADGAFGPEPILTAPRARQTLRTGQPVEVPLAVDIDGDGLTDAVVPNGENLEVWLQRAATGGAERISFTKGASVHVPVSIARSTGGVALSDRLNAAITIPNLRRVDVNGDGRLDLVVEEGELRAFHLVRADGTIATEPDSVLDLSIFRDTTGDAQVAPGRTLAGLDRALHEMRDLNRDGIPDHVIAHRRKVWVFHGGHEAPQFQSPTSVLKTADDVTALLLLDLDGDARADLVLLRLQIPTVAALLRGLVSEWEIEVSAVGYRARGERDFEASPAWRSHLAFRVPAILSILKDPEAIVQRFEDAGDKLRASAEGDLDGDGRADAIVVSEDGTHVDAWLGEADVARAVRETPAEIVRRALFAEEESTWDLDRLVGWFAGVAEQRIQALTGGRAPNGRSPLRPAEEWRLTSVEAVDLDGDARAEVVLRYDAPDGSKSVLDILRWRAGP
jgi:hypothetical protein